MSERAVLLGHSSWLVFKDGDGDLSRCSCGEQGYDFAQGREWFAQHILDVERANAIILDPDILRLAMDEASPYANRRTEATEVASIYARLMAGEWLHIGQEGYPYEEFA